MPKLVNVPKSMDYTVKTGTAKDKQTLIYLIYMAERLILMKKILKPTGSIYYHCDPTASHYIKVIMDGYLEGRVLEMRLFGVIKSGQQQVGIFPGIMI